MKASPPQAPVHRERWGNLPGKNFDPFLIRWLFRSTYDILISSPMGEQPGKIRFVIDGTTLSGVLTILDKDNAFSGGTIDNGGLSFSGDLKTPMRNISYTVSGTFVDGKIDVIAKTKMGELSIRSR